MIFQLCQPQPEFICLVILTFLTLSQFEREALIEELGEVGTKGMIPWADRDTCTHDTFYCTLSSISHIQSSRSHLTYDSPPLLGTSSPSNTTTSNFGKTSSRPRGSRPPASCNRWPTPSSMSWGTGGRAVRCRGGWVPQPPFPTPLALPLPAPTRPWQAWGRMRPASPSSEP